MTTPQGNKLARYPGGVHLSYTPMVHAKVFLKTKGVKDPQFNLALGEEGNGEDMAGIEGGDRPLFVQVSTPFQQICLLTRSSAPTTPMSS